MAEINNPAMTVMCRLGKNVRTLRIEKLPNGNCRTLYTKAGKDQNIGNGQNPQSCEEILNKVKAVLEANSWKCKSVQESRVSSLETL